ncbi:hypothetical protein BDV59DRAFT_178891 [Aspergillus ambiguus]|uniref:SANT/Myb-like DNA-binding domain-containing protein n=1 Tax=Aspergillus ambiguus TaxID=176160 RepID=UPI003CCCFF88
MDYTRKRRRETGSATDSETESDEDDTFSLYERAVNVPRRRAEKPDQSRHKRARREESDYDSPTRQLQDDIETATPTKQRRSPRVVVSPRRSPSIPYPITTTDRKRWVDDEDNRLVRLIELFGAKWAKIERENSVLPEEEGERRIEGRNQVQLKDRARNLKTKFLREGQPLPRNFDKVTMKAKDYEKLRRMGIAVPE